MSKNRINELNDYIIPPNFARQGTIFGGMLKTRNCFEAVLFSVPIAYLLNLIPISLQYRVILIIFLAVPVGAVALFGVNDGPLSVFIADFFKHIVSKNSLEYYSFGISEDDSSKSKKSKNKKRKG